GVLDDLAIGDDDAGLGRSGDVNVVYAGERRDDPAQLVSGGNDRSGNGEARTGDDDVRRCEFGRGCEASVVLERMSEFGKPGGDRLKRCRWPSPNRDDCW